MWSYLLKLKGVWSRLAFEVVYEEAALAEVDDLPREAGSMGPLVSKLEVVLLAFEAAVAEVDDLPREAGLMSTGPLVAVYDEGHLK